MPKKTPKQSTPAQSGDLIPQHKRMAMGQPIPQGSMPKKPKK